MKQLSKLSKWSQPYQNILFLKKRIIDIVGRVLTIFSVWNLNENYNINGLQEQVRSYLCRFTQNRQTMGNRNGSFGSNASANTKYFCSYRVRLPMPSIPTLAFSKGKLIEFPHNRNPAGSTSTENRFPKELPQKDNTRSTWSRQTTSSMRTVGSWKNCRGWDSGSGPYSLFGLFWLLLTIWSVESHLTKAFALQKLRVESLSTAQICSSTTQKKTFACWVKI